MTDSAEPLTTGDLFRHLRTLVLGRPWTFAAIACAVAGAYLAWSQSAAPVYRASAKVFVEDVARKSPQLEHRGIPTGAVTAGEALTVLRSRSLAARIVEQMSDAHPCGLGLTTWVTDENASPLSRALRGVLGNHDPRFRIAARAVRETEDAPTAARVRFVAPDEVSLSVSSGRPGFEWSDERIERVAYRAGEPIEYAGLRIELDVLGGTPDDRVWRIEALERDEAIDRVLARVRVDEQQHQPGTLGIVVTDSDAGRAADIANALTEAFVQDDLERTRGRALQKADFVAAELEGRRAELARLHTERAELLVRHPDAVAPEAVATELAEREGVWDDAWRRAQASRIAGEKALDRLAAGEAPRVALATLPNGVPAELAAVVAALDAEEAQLRNVARGSADPGYRRTLLLKADDATVAAQEFDTRVMDLATIVAAFERGEDAALARLGGDGAREGSVAVDWSIRTWLEELNAARGRREALLVEFKPNAPPVRVEDERIAHYRASILAGLRVQLEGLEATRARKAEHAAFWRDLYERYPGEEARIVRASIAELRAEVATTLAAWVVGRHAEEDRAWDEREHLRTRMRGIALAKRDLERTAPELRELEVVVGELLRDAENVAIAAAGIEPSVRVVDAAAVPRGRLKPRAGFGLVAGAFLGLLVALAWATVRDGGDSGTVAREDAPRPDADLGLDLGEVGVAGLLGGAPRVLRKLVGEAGERTSLWVPLVTAPEGAPARAFHRLRTRLVRLRSTDGEAPRVLGIVATAGGDTASVVAANLALARARSGERVALVDGDLWAPRLVEGLAAAGVGIPAPDPTTPLGFPRPDHPIFANARAGLAQLVGGHAPLERVALPTSEPCLDLIDAGASLASPTDLLGHARLAAVLRELGSAYDAVIVHLPSPEGSADAEVCGPALDGFLLVAAPEASDADVARTAGLLAEAGGTVLATVRGTRVDRRVAVDHRWTA